VSRWCPHAWEAFLDYRKNAAELSSIDVRIIQAIGKDDLQAALDVARELGWLEEGPKGLRPNRERDELARKLDLLNLPVPWRTRV
jgi:thymidylate synthase (FAD)